MLASGWPFLGAEGLDLLQSILQPLWALMSSLSRVREANSRWQNSWVPSPL